MPLTNDEILEAIKANELNIQDMSDDCLEPASYDLRIGDPLLKGGEAAPIRLREIGSVTIRAGEFFIFRTHEKLHLTNIVSGHLGAKSYFIQRGLILLCGHHVDPGFDGFLLMGGYNASPRDVVVRYLDKICNIEFHKLAQPATKRLREFPELRSGELPKTIRDYFMGIEPVSVYKLSESMSSMAQNVSTMSKGIEDLSREVALLSKLMWRLIVPLIAATFVAVVVRFIIGI
ncbi:MAG: hypothetical protein QMC90_01690 [Dehalococcoidales bacterium]|nr:hypothetical protein [Dehalococcoidales bacterium]